MQKRSKSLSQNAGRVDGLLSSSSSSSSSKFSGKTEDEDEKENEDEGRFGNFQIHSKWLRSPRMWIELFVLFNLAGLAPDIFLAHSVNSFRAPAEYIPLVFSLAAPLLLIPAIWSLAQSRLQPWRVLGHFAGWMSVVIGVAGLILHLQSQFFRQWTLASLVYAAPFAAPLAYTGIGLLLIMNRMVDCEKIDWPLWVIFLALGGFAGNFIFSVTDHAQNGFFRRSEWIPVISSALAVGFLIMPLMMRVGRAYLRICAVVMVLQVAVGIAGFVLHVDADLHAVGQHFLTGSSTERRCLRRCCFPIWPCWRELGYGCFTKNFPRQNPWRSRRPFRHGRVALPSLSQNNFPSEGRVTRAPIFRGIR